MNVPFLDLREGYSELQERIEDAVRAVLRSGRYVGGPHVGRFEAEFAGWTGARHCVGVANGLDAIYLALCACGIGVGDEVLVPANTYVATWLAVSRCGARPVPIEPMEATHNMDPARIEEAINPRTRAIVPVHLYGQPADLDPILAIARERGLKVVEDAAQSHGARYKGKCIGSHGDAVAWSFYPTKNLGAMGDAGAVTTNDPQIAERVRMLGNYGTRERYVSEAAGVNSRLDPVQAAVLSAKLGVVDEWNSRRARIAHRYAMDLGDTAIALPVVPAWAAPAWHLYVVRSPDRDALRGRLAERGIDTLIHYPKPPHMQPAYAGSGYPSCPIAERLANEVLSLPLGPHMDDAAVDAVIDAVRKSARS